MASSSVICLAVLFVCFVAVNGAPQFGGGGFSQANAQAGSFGGGFQRPGFGFQGPPGPPGYGPGFGGPGGFRRPNFGGRGLGGGSGSISISKSISISRGGAGGAQSSASSNAGSFGK
ncbi:hypothetical protein MSG28_010709 [Choristoneura fumiferana]|uniref:Uncharacterized protein n=1 Tax=Choristoneura fumiferana TaxID=7141 RepID=A0ACC0KP68_CHOFU|nr:hypothetical protein MSG28_010709 [Choristoneura fumiferana]